MGRFLGAVFVTVVFFHIDLLVLGLVTEGRNFIVACPSLTPNYPSVVCTLHVVGPQGTVITLRGTLPALPKIVTVSSANLSKISMLGNPSSAQALVITTSIDVSIFVENQAYGTSVYLALPILQDLTQSFTGPPTEDFLFAIPDPPEVNMYVIASAYAGTSVTLSIKSTGQFTHDNVVYTNGGSLNVVLGTGEALQIDTVEDLTGTVIISTNPIAVFVGSKLQTTFEQVPPPADWYSFIVVGWLDLCTNQTTRILASENSTIDGIQLKKGEFMNYAHNGTQLTGSDGNMLFGVRCRIGSNSQPFTMFWRRMFGLEYKCLALSGSAIVYAIAIRIDATSFNVSGQSVPFHLVDTLNSARISTLRSSVSSGYIDITHTELFDVYMTGSSPSYAYGYACAMGAFGEQRPDPDNSIVNIVLSIAAPPTVASTTVSDTSSLISTTSISTIIPTSSASVAISTTSSSTIIPTSSASVAISTTSSSTIIPTSSASVPISTTSSSTMAATSSASVTAPTTPEVTTSMTTTQTTPPMTTSLLEQCFCKCGENELLPNETQAFLENFDMEIKKNLTVDVKGLSSYIRTKTSAEDSRPSAKNVGFIGITLITVTFGFLVAVDLLSLLKIAKPKVKAS